MKKLVFALALALAVDGRRLHPHEYARRRLPAG